jgi:ABC-type glycerol-3-phosphate transport system substrate-binding protein
MKTQQNRRQFLASSGVAGAALLLAACGSSSTSGGGSGDAAKGSVSFVVWASDQELAAYKAAIKDFERENPGATVVLKNVPYEQVKQNIDAGLEAGKAPDLFRVTYQDLGFYSSQQALADLSSYLPSGFSGQFVEGIWSATLFDGKPYAIPAHTDVSCMVYNKKLFGAAGITSVPDAVDNAWTWDEFYANATKIKDSTPGAYGFAMNWQQAGAYRWLNWLAQAGGRLLSDDLKSSALDSPETTKTLQFFQQWFKDGVVPKNTTPKGKYPDELFPAGKIGMISGGDFLVPSIDSTVKKFEWGVMPLPKDQGAATDLGGTAVVVTAQSKNQALAAKFAAFLGSTAQMKRFCETTGTLPVRNDLVDAQLRFASRPDVMPVFQQQVKTLPPSLVQSVTIPKFTQINTAFTDELEQLTSRGQAVDKTIANLNAAVQKNLAA